MSHVITDMSSHYVFTMSFSAEITTLTVVSWESLHAVGNVDSSINSTLHGSKHTGTSRGPHQSNIEESSEWSWLVI